MSGTGSECLRWTGEVQYERIMHARSRSMPDRECVGTMPARLSLLNGKMLKLSMMPGYNDGGHYEADIKYGI